MINYEVVIGVGVKSDRTLRFDGIDILRRSNWDIIRLVWLLSLGIVSVLDVVFLIEEEDVDLGVDAGDRLADRARAFEGTPNMVTVRLDRFHAHPGVALIGEVELRAWCAAWSWFLSDVSSTPCRSGSTWFCAW